jgi:hypothetical protein
MTPRERRVIVAGAAVSLLAVLATKTVPWMAAEYDALTAAMTRELDTRRHTRLTVTSLPATTDSLVAALREFVELAPRLLGAGMADDAAAALEGDVRLAAASIGLATAVERSPRDPVPTRGAFQPVRLRVQVEGRAEQIMRFLQWAATAERLLTVESLSLTFEQDGAPEHAARATVVLRGWRFDRGAG